MRITAVDTFVVSNRRVLVKISTDRGISGWGEPVLENWARTTVAAVQRLAEHLIGQDPRPITALWQVLSRGGFYRGGALLGSAVAGIDQALWDIKARALDAPIHELLGGPTRDWVTVYAAGSSETRTGDLDLIRAHVAAGVRMIKIVPPGPVLPLDSAASIESVVAGLTEVRQLVGNDIDIALDLHGRYSLAQSRRLLRELEPLRPVFVEEPLRPEHQGHLGRLVSDTIIPIATGERLYSRDEFLPVLQAGVAVVQPDLSHAHGITECFRIATLAETFDALIAPHCPLGPVALAACLQLDFAVPNVLAQEQGLGLQYGPSDDLGILGDPAPLTVVEGRIARLTGPGLGIEIDEDAVRSRVVEGALDAGSPVWMHADGSFAEW